MTQPLRTAVALLHGIHVWIVRERIGGGKKKGFFLVNVKIVAKPKRYKRKTNPPKETSFHPQNQTPD